MNNTILVTGGAGYIGSHVCKELLSHGYKPVTYDNLSRGHKWAVKWGPLEVGDILDRDRILKVMKKYKPIAVMHFAAYAYVGESVTNPLLYYQNNVTGTLSLLEAMIGMGVHLMIFSSSCATYGKPHSLPIMESHPQNPISPYGKSKLMIENILRDFDTAYGLKSISLRYFNAAGADPEGEIGEIHDPEPHLIPRVLETAMGLQKYVEVYGNRYKTTDGTCVRDYIHVMDLATAHVLALNQIISRSHSDNFNLGTGRGYSVNDILIAAQKLTKREIPFKIMPPRAGDPSVLVADSTKFQNKMGWQPMYSTLDKILSDALYWQESNRHTK